jgi:hypothetical protein
MRMSIDKCHILDEEFFTYRATKDSTVFLYWHGKQVKIIKGKQAQQFLAKITLLDPREAQLVMAKLTGNFKRGNERKGD